MGGAVLVSKVATQNGTGDAYSPVLDTKDTKSKSIVYMFAGITEFKENPITLYLQASNDNSSWTNIKSWTCSINGPFQSNPGKTEQFNSSYRYFRCFIDGLNGGCRGTAMVAAIVKD